MIQGGLLRRGCKRRDANFRAKFHAAIVSIRREGTALEGKMGDVVLRAGDELLFDCGDDFDAAAPAVVANLTAVAAVESAAVQEFMVAFEVLGVSPPLSPRHVMCCDDVNSVGSFAKD